VERLSRGFKLSLGYIIGYTLRAGPLRELGDLTHFHDTNFSGRHSSFCFSEIGEPNYDKYCEDIQSSSVLP